MLDLSALRTLIALKDAIGNKEPHQPRSVTAAALAKSKARKRNAAKAATLAQRYWQPVDYAGSENRAVQWFEEVTQLTPEQIEAVQRAVKVPNTWDKYGLGVMRVHDEITIKGEPKAQYTAPTIEVTEIDTKNF